VEYPFFETDGPCLLWMMLVGVLDLGPWKGQVNLVPPLMSKQLVPQQDQWNEGSVRV
jgi:hypothetical protein